MKKKYIAKGVLFEVHFKDGSKVPVRAVSNADAVRTVARDFRVGSRELYATHIRES